MGMPYFRSFRIVCEQRLIPLVETLLAEEGYELEPEPFSPWCRKLLAEPVPLGRSLAAFFGYIYIQDRSSMLPPLALAPAPGECALDLCASPGSKASFLAQLTGPAGFVLANEPSPARLGTLRANMGQMNLIAAATCSYGGQSIPLAPSSWNAILLDPPCSGWGTAGKNPRVLKLWRGEKVERLIRLQQMLLRRAALLLQPGGRLIYSTCTTNVAENEAQVAFAERELGLERVPLAPFPGFFWKEEPGGEGTLRVDGARSQAQDFYLALLRKPATSPCTAKNFAGGKPSLSGRILPLSQLAGPCCDPSRLPPGRAASFGEGVYFLPDGSRNLLTPGFVWQGASLGRLAGGLFSPSPRLRAFMPDPMRHPGHSLVLDDVAEVRRLLSGRSLPTDLPGKEAALWWRGLPLGRIAVRQGRAIAVFR